MKAAQINEYGHADAVKVQETVKPSAGVGQVLVEVHASSINPFDTMIREGYLKEMIPLKLPVTLGGDIAGIVAEVGQDVVNLKVGDRVFGQANAVAGNSGAFAEFAVTKAEQVGPMPRNIDFTDAAAIVLVGLSAYQVIYEHIKLTSGQKILIHGGAGGIGSIAIQIAKNLGAYVATTATGDGLEFVKTIGADVVIDYKTQKFEEIINNYDAVFDTVGDDTFERSFLVLKKGGVLVSMIAQPNEQLANQYEVVNLYQSTHTSTEQLAGLAKLIDDDVVKVHVDKVFSLDQIQQAFEAREAGTIKGKVAINIKD